MPKFKIRHVTKYIYETPVRDSANQIILDPLKDEYQDVQQHQIKVTGGVSIEMHTDYFGNEVGTFTHAQSHKDLSIDSRMVVVTRAKELPTDETPATRQWEDLSKLKDQAQFIDFLQQEYFAGVSEANDTVNLVRGKSVTPLASSIELCSFVFDHFVYRKGITTVESTLDEIWKIKTGVCQDFAQVLLAMLRLMDI